MPRGLDARLDRLEQRLSPAPSDDMRELVRWLTFSELELCQAVGNDLEAFESVLTPLLPLAEARRVAGANMTVLDQLERAGERVARVRDPDKPNDPLANFYITVVRHPIIRNHWMPRDEWYREKWGERWSLPPLMTTAQIEALCPYGPGDHRCHCTRRQWSSGMTQ
jgi:hypothetical protein